MFELLAEASLWPCNVDLAMDDVGAFDGTAIDATGATLLQKY